MRLPVILFVSSIAVICTGCDDGTKTISHVVESDGSCQPMSSLVDKLEVSQLGCHEGKPGDGVQFIVSSSQSKVSLESDTRQRQLLSIFVKPASILQTSGSIPFTAYYSSGQYELRGKTGCVGVLESGTVRVEPGERTLFYSLKFRLVSPLGWKGDCDAEHIAEGRIEL